MRPDDPASATVILMRAKRAEDLLLVTGSEKQVLRLLRNHQDDILDATPRTRRALQYRRPSREPTRHPL